MELRVKKLCRSRVGGISSLELAKKAMEKKIDSFVVDRNIVIEVSVVSSRRRHPERIELKIEYKNPVGVVEAYKHGRRYGDLPRGLSLRLEEDSYSVNMDIKGDSVFSSEGGAWKLRERRDSEYCEIGGKSLLWFFAHGDISRRDDYYSKIVESSGYSGVDLKFKGRPVIENALLRLMREVDEISDSEVLVGKRFAEKWLRPFLTVGENLPNGVEEVGMVAGSYIYEEVPSSVDGLLVEVPVSLGRGKDIIAVYHCSLGK